MTSLTPIKENTLLIFLALVQPLLFIFFIPSLLFDETTSIDAYTVNFYFIIILVFYNCCLYTFGYYNPRLCRVLVPLLYLTFFVWAIFQAADFNKYLHRSIWSVIYLFILLFEILLFWIYM
jgi:hypothetical protein